MRNRAVDFVTAATIGGVPGGTVRTWEKLPGDCEEASAAMLHWKSMGHYRLLLSGRRGSPEHPDSQVRSAAFMFGVAASLGRAVLVLQLDQWDRIKTPISLYGERDTNDNLVTTKQSGTKPPTVQFHRGVSWCKALKLLKGRPRPVSVVMFTPGNETSAAHHTPVVRGMNANSQRHVSSSASSEHAPSTHPRSTYRSTPRPTTLDSSIHMQVARTAAVVAVVGVGVLRCLRLRLLHPMVVSEQTESSGPPTPVPQKQPTVENSKRRKI